MLEKHNFTKSSKPTRKFDNFTGDTIKEAIPQLVTSGMKFGNFYDLATGRMTQYNPDENDRNILYNNMFDLPGNPIFSLETNGELVVVHDLEQTDLQFVKEIISGINKNTNLNNSYSHDFGNRDIYEAIKKSDGSFTIDKYVANELRNNAYNNNIARSRIVNHLFQGDKEKAKEYISLVKEQHKANSIDSILGFYPGQFTGMRLLVGGPVSSSGSCILGGLNLGYSASLLGVGDGVDSIRGATAQKNYSTKSQIISLDKILQHNKFGKTLHPNKLNY